MIAYASRQLKVHKKNSPTHDLELAAVVFTLKLWRPYLYGIHVDVFRDHNSLHNMFTQRELNLRQQRWLELLKDYDMDVYFNQGKDNVVADTLSRMSMGSTVHIVDEKKKLVKYVHRLTIVGVQLVDSTTGGVSVHSRSE